MISVTGGAVRIVASGDSELDDMQLTPDGKTMVYTEQTGSRPSRSSARPRAAALPSPSPTSTMRCSTAASSPRSRNSGSTAPTARASTSFVVKPYGFHAGPQVSRRSC